MDKRANDVIEKLHMMNLVTEKFSNQPRLVIPKCFEDLSEEVVTFLNHHGYSEEQIREAFQSREENQIL